MGSIHEDVLTFGTISGWIILKMRKFSIKSFKRKIKTRILYSLTVIFLGYHTVYEMVEPEAAGNMADARGMCAHECTHMHMHMHTNTQAV